MEAGEFDSAMAVLDELATQPRVVAIGETGLDYFRTEPERQDAQREAFLAHIALAKKHNLALQIHDRDAHDDVVSLLRTVGAPAKTVFHCYSGDGDLAHILAAEGWYASFSGTVTFKNSEGIRDALRVMPESQILIETDTPFLTPTPFRGRPNSPYMVPYTLRSMADTLGMEESLLAAQIAANTIDVYGPFDKSLSFSFPPRSKRVPSPTPLLGASEIRALAERAGVTPTKKTGPELRPRCQHCAKDCCCCWSARGRSCPRSGPGVRLAHPGASRCGSCCDRDRN